ncbi:hypothetical protein EVJ24_08745 [Exiguobacterium sp. SH1S21]|uniref:hypothetical protein n=1 Tax=Exiguobacterium sp. SH1S21 TaxID=2510953 RepID=UPI00103CEB42|nr:hypothetical protein [Exiguobacterium sp. SH1S21]TCI53766.1 hypothetical protein EVJ24_08745 [Exiguobacterium sp. SH1S21]
MKRIILGIGLVAVMALSACAVNPDATEHYKQQTPLQATLDFPEVVEAGEPITFEIGLTKQGNVAPDFVHLELQKADGTLSYGMQEAARLDDGTYELTTSVKEDGLYIARIHAQADGSTIFPAKQFIVGELTEAEWAALYEGAAPVEAVTEPHH